MGLCNALLVEFSFDHTSYSHWEEDSIRLLVLEVCLGRRHNISDSLSDMIRILAPDRIGLWTLSKLLCTKLSSVPNNKPVMRLIIVAYREYHDCTIKFPEGQITLLNGVSESGKSTIIRAIQWCLYGGSASGEKYEVQLKYRKLHIIRRSKPKIIEVSSKVTGKTFLGDVAEQVIVAEFGSEELFSLCCYIKQGNIPCPLLNSSNQERLRYLNEFAFRGEEDPIIIIEAIARRLQVVRASYRKRRTIYQTHKQSLKLLEEEIGNPSAGEAEEMEQLRSKVVDLTAKLEEVQTRLISNEKLKSVIQELEEQLTRLRNRKSVIESELPSRVGADEQLRLTEELKGIENSLVALDQAELFDARDELVDRLQKELPDGFIPSFTVRDYYALETQHREYEEEKEQVCETWY